MDFVKKSKELYGENYLDYNNCIYRGLHEPVVLRCPVHNYFSVFPDKHLSGKGGCIRCRLPTSQDIDKQVNILMIRKNYDYMEDDGINVELFCPEHQQVSKLSRIGHVNGQVACCCASDAV